MKYSVFSMEMLANKIPFLVKERDFSYGIVDSSDKAVELIEQVFRASRKAEEHCYLIAQNAKREPVGVFEVSHGGVNYSICSPREIFQRALMCGATSVIILHNHPSGNTGESREDVRVCRQLVDAGKLMCIPVDDFIIITGDSYKSFREEEIL